MGSFEDIRYDHIYTNGSYLFTLLHDQLTNLAAAGPSPVFLFRHATLLRFITIFNNLVQCQTYIHTNNRKMVTLVLSDERLLEWNDTIPGTDDNIQEVYIFCHTYSKYLEMKRWNGCYRGAIRGVHLPDTLEHKLLRLGVDYIYQILPEFRRERGMYDRINTDARDLLAALDNYFQEQIDTLEDDATEELP